MSITIDATAGGASSNSFLDVSRAIVIAGSRIGGSVFTNADADIQAAALISATSRLDALRFLGTPTTGTQALQFPRENCPNRMGVPVDPTTIPYNLEQAAVARAIDEIRAGTSSDGSGITVTDPNLKTIIADGVEVEYFAQGEKVTSLSAQYDTSDLSAEILRLIGYMLATDPSIVLASSGWGCAKAIRAS